jgi:glycosyltransferase involved in cell wall biosynthesis
VIVVNHNSQDDTRFILEEFKKNHKELQSVNLEQEAKGIYGKKYPLSIGIKEAKYEILLLTDADCQPGSPHWMKRMQDGYLEETDIVLGFGSYYKRPGLLNALIRFETFQTGLQYLSYALAGLPYMGVGRNLSYKKKLFIDHKGFSFMNHLTGGDDDLFVNKWATAQNTEVVVHPEAFTYSEPKKTFGHWIRQKNRHYTTARYYKPLHKFLLTLFHITQFLYYPLLISCCLFYDAKLMAGLFAARFLTQGVIYFLGMRKLGMSDLFPWWGLFDLWSFFYYWLFIPALFKKPATQWR